MKNLQLALSFTFIASAVFFASCKTEECHECHYENAKGEEVELGEFCEAELEDLEANGKLVNDTTYEVHCHEH